MDKRKVVIEAATSLHLLEDEEHLRPVDSLSMLELAAAIEKRIGRVIPAAELRREMFGTVSAIVALLDGLDRA